MGGMALRSDRPGDMAGGDNLFACLVGALGPTAAGSRTTAPTQTGQERAHRQGDTPNTAAHCPTATRPSRPSVVLKFMFDLHHGAQGR